MAKRQSTQCCAVPAVAYLRRSTSRQEKSLDDQRTEIERYAAANGYRILRWFQDDGISGDATERREGFLAFHRAACNGRDFDVILVWDQDRFGRFDSMEAGYWIHPLRKAGVRLVSVTEGPINWDDFTGRVMYSLKQEGKHQFLRDLSRNVMRGQISNAQRGWLCGRMAPYGYDRMLVDEAGVHRQRVRHGERFSKPRSWRTTLVPSDDVMKVAVVKSLFQDYVELDLGLRGMAERLNARGIPGPTGGPWYAAAIRMILESQTYVGTLTWAKRRAGKYHVATAGQIRERDRSEVKLSPNGQPCAKNNPAEAWIVVENAHEPLIDKQLFERVQARLTQRRRSNVGVGYRTHTKANHDIYVLSGLVFCDHCGRRMHGVSKKRRTNGEASQRARYMCPTFNRCGLNNPTNCGCHFVEQDGLVRLLKNKLKCEVLSNDSLKKVRKNLRALLERRRGGGGQSVDALRRRIGELGREIDHASENFLRAPSELLDLIAEKLTTLKRQKETAEQELRAMAIANSPTDVAREVDDAIAQLERLGESLDDLDVSRQRAVFQALVDRIDLRFDRKPRGKRFKYPLISGEIHVRTASDGLLSSANHSGP